MTKARDLADYTGLQADLAGLQTNITAGDTAARAGRKNLFINGGCQVGQRGNVALSNSVVKYGACDRWGMYPNVSGTHSATSSQATVTWSESGNAIGWTAVTTVQAGLMLTRQFIESSNVRHLTGKKLTCSFKVFHDVGADVSVNVLTLKPNSKDNFANTTDLTSNTMIATAASGVVTEVSYTWPNALTAADCVNGFCVTIQLGTSTSVTNKNFYVADLQLEEGSVATDFEHRSFGEELALCQRYFCKSFNLGTTPANDTNDDHNGWGGLTAYSVNTTRSPPFFFPNRMRIVPTIICYNANSNDADGRWGYYQNSAWVSASSTTAVSKATDTYFYPSVAGSFAATDSYLGRGHYTADAEL